MRLCLFALALTLLPSLAQDTPSAPSGIYKSVVRIEVASQVPDYGTPWNAGRFSGGIGSGFLIGKNKFLTNAHVVSDAARIMINIYGSPKKYAAKVEHIAHDCDLALLSVENFTDFEELPVFEFGNVPALESQVRVIGYPIGGERLSVTRGVVSRIDFSTYSHSRADSHLIVQIDAAINPGNSGGPVVQEDKVVGVAFQGLRQADNTGYIIPTPVIRRFLKDVEDGTYDSYVDLGASTFPLFNPAMREAFKLPDERNGVLVTSVIPTGSADGVIKPGDVILALGGKEVDSAGMINLDGEDVDMNEIVERKFVGDKLAVRYLRDGKAEEAEVVLKTLAPSRMYAIQYEKKPRYILFAGLVFQPLDTNLLGSVKLDDLNIRRLYTQYVPKGLFQTRPDIVVLTRIESDPLTSQMGEFSGYAVDKINGVEVKDLVHAHELLNPAEAPEYFVIELFGASRPLVIPAKEVEAAEKRVQLNYDIKNPSRLEN
jgi:S1-C subfamily serine protease